MSGSLSRSRWAAVGAAVAVAFGSGAVWIAGAAGDTSSAQASLVAIAPCRLMDTREAYQVGPRSTPLGADDTYNAAVWGINGDCTIPTSAVAVSLNVTAVSPSAPSYLTVFPSDATRPTASNLNFTSGQVVPNAVTAKLSADGELSFYNLAGTVDVIADVVGYYTATASAGGPANLGYQLTLPDAAHTGGAYSSTTIGVDGLPIISHTEFPKGDLLVTHCNDTACLTSTTHTIDSSAEFQYTSIAIGTDGLAVISYYDYDASNGDLKVAHCADTACTTATTTLFASASDAGAGNSLAVGADGYPLISYRDATSMLVVARCNNPTCTSTVSVAVVDNSADVGTWNSIAIGADGLPILSYSDDTNSRLKVAHCDNASCSVSTKSIVDSGPSVGPANSITIGSDGLAIISYDTWAGSLKVAHCIDTSCTTATVSTIDSSLVFNHTTSITIGADGLAFISYTATNGSLKVAHCNSPDCARSTATLLDSHSDFSAVTIGVDGLPILSHYDDTGKLEVVHCSNTFCTPNVRRR